jgi:hypothetical protein
MHRPLLADHPLLFFNSSSFFDSITLLHP